MNDILILTSLLTGPKHGYLIKKHAGLILGGSELHNNLVYPLLHRFERQGWVGKRKSRGERGQTRLEYFLKPAGRAEIIRRIEDYSDSEASDEAFYLRAGLFDLVGPETRSRILRAREEELERLAAHLAGITEEFHPGGYAGEVVDYMQRKTEFELAWVRSLDASARPRSRSVPTRTAPKDGRTRNNACLAGRGEA